ncbi:hypothetical protein HK104_007512 [Borealophlyctis nickersoniae]|nr:hypothetical protein HK104_007512 [Borealophlyctis nickersoniae]
MDRPTFDERIRTLDARVGQLLLPKHFIALPIVLSFCGFLGSCFFFIGDVHEGFPVIFTLCGLTVFFTITLVSFSYHRTGQTKPELVKVLNEFNQRDNVVGLNWLMTTQEFVQTAVFQDGARVPYRTEILCAKLEIMQVASGPTVPPRANEIPPTAGPYGVAFSPLADPKAHPVYGAPYQQAPYQQAPYQQAPYQQAPYQQAPYNQAPRNGL